MKPQSISIKTEHKPSGKWYWMEKRQQWGSFYHSFDSGDTWHKKRSDAFNAAKEAGKLWEVKEQNPMPTRKKTTRRKSTKPPSPAQLRARKKFIAMVKARSKASKKKAVKNAAKRRNKTIIKAKRIDHLDVSKIHNPGNPKRRNKTIITKPKKVVVINPAAGHYLEKTRRAIRAMEESRRNWTISLNSTRKQLDRARRAGDRSDIRDLTATAKYEHEQLKKIDRELALLKRQAAKYSKTGNPAKSTRRKYRNGYLDLVIMGHAKKTPAGWSLGGKTFKQGKGIVPASKRGYYLDLGTGTVFSKKARNAEHRDADHPIEVTRHYRSGPPGYMTPWQRAHSQGQQGLFDHGIKGAKKRNARKTLTGAKGDRRIKSPDAKFFVSTAVLWYSRGESTKQVMDKLKSKGFTVAQAKKISRSARASSRYAHRLANPSVKSIRKEFAGTVGKATDAFAPIGTPRNVAKLGKLLFIDTENATIRPTGVVYLCADTKGKLHLCGSKNVPIYSGAAQSFGRVRKLEYETAKPHLYPGQGTIQFWHKMGEESGNQPTLYADGKGGLKFRGGSYRITREGIVD